MDKSNYKKILLFTVMLLLAFMMTIWILCIIIDVDYSFIIHDLSALILVSTCFTISILTLGK
jgi:hypothetical protein